MGAISWALALAACAVVAAPQAPWHPQVRAAWVHGQHVVHGWLNPQLVTTPQAPPSHENFGRAGDEYKLPVAETIPDATTDPTQIRVTPVIDPTAKKPNDAAGNPNQTTTPTDTTPGNPSDPFQAPAGQVQEKPAPESQPAPATAQPSGGTGTVAAPAPAPSAPAAVPPPVASAPATVTYTPTSSEPPAAARNPQSGSASVSLGSFPARAPATTTANSAIPSSLKSQMASMAPEASGNKAPEAAMNSIEPVAVAELTERGLLTEQPAVGYPANAKGQQGTVILQVLIGRDGAVQDAKFMQGSLAFARTAIDGVKLWKFKPYMMNGRAVSVQVPMTISFRPGQ
jgi:protein TonB